MISSSIVSLIVCRATLHLPEVPFENTSPGGVFPVLLLAVRPCVPIYLLTSNFNQRTFWSTGAYTPTYLLVYSATRSAFSSAYCRTILRIPHISEVETLYIYAAPPRVRTRTGNSYLLTFYDAWCSYCKLLTLTDTTTGMILIMYKRHIPRGWTFTGEANTVSCGGAA